MRLVAHSTAAAAAAVATVLYAEEDFLSLFMSSFSFFAVSATPRPSFYCLIDASECGERKAIMHSLFYADRQIYTFLLLLFAIRFGHYASSARRRGGGGRSKRRSVQ
jgi:hypothetical protein